MLGLCYEAAGDASVILVKGHDPLDGGTCVGPGFVGKPTFSDQSLNFSLDDFAFVDSCST
jgi:hypothetical protein